MWMHTHRSSLQHQWLLVRRSEMGQERTGVVCMQLPLGLVPSSLSHTELTGQQVFAQKLQETGYVTLAGFLSLKLTIFLV